MKRRMKNIISIIVICMVLSCVFIGCADMETTDQTILEGTRSTFEPVGETSATVPTQPPYTTPATPATTVPSTTTDNNSTHDSTRYFDFEQRHKPTEADISQVKENMAIAEVVELLGKPHDYGPTSGMTTIVWQTDEGNWYCVYVLCGGSDSDHVNIQIFEYGVCMAIIPL